MHEPTTIGVLPIQRVVATASPSAWRDALVEAVDSATVDVVDLAGARSSLLTDAVVQTSEPVAYHPVAEILAVGGIWYSARVAA